MTSKTITKRIDVPADLWQLVQEAALRQQTSVHQYVTHVLANHFATKLPLMVDDEQERTRPDEFGATRSEQLRRAAESQDDAGHYRLDEPANTPRRWWEQRSWWVKGTNESELD